MAYLLARVEQQRQNQGHKFVAAVVFIHVHAPHQRIDRPLAHLEIAVGERLFEQRDALVQRQHAAAVKALHADV